MVRIPKGEYVPFVLRSERNKDEKAEFVRRPTQVGAFSLDRSLVSRRQFLKFLKAKPEWRKSKVARVFADPHYLDDWQSDLKLKSDADLDRPVTHVSWFAAKAYCEFLGMTLPTTDQWEYALEDQGRHKQEVSHAILEWYSEPNSRAQSKVGSTPANGFGVQDLIGVAWEWTLDFNSFLAGDEMREGSSKQDALFCGGGSLGKLDPSDYASFMRYSFRTSLKASYTTANLGFRCAKENL